MRLLASAIGLAALAAPLPAHAQIETIDPDTEIAPPETNDALAARLADPAAQQQMAATLAALSDVLLDLPLAPLARALADAGVEAADDIPMDTTLRKLAPGSTRVQDEVTERLPQMMGSMAQLSKGMQEMMPALKEMAKRMREAIPPEPAS